MMIDQKWDERFTRLAEHIAQWSKDPSTKVGAVIVDPKRRVVGMGYNGFPRGVADTFIRYHDREQKYEMIVHAEINAILNAVQSVAGCTLYTWPLKTCARCAAAVIQAGITDVVVPSTGQTMHDKWVESWNVAQRMYQEAGISLREVVIYE